MILSALLTSVGINLGLCFLFFTLYSILRKQPGNAEVYAPRLVAEGKSQQSSNFNLERLLPSAGWVTRAWRPSEAELLSTSGLDAVVFMRIFIFSARVFTFAVIVGIFILLPINYMGKQLSLDLFDLPNKSLESFTISNVDDGSNRLWIHFSAVYILTAVVCYLLYFEYDYISSKRISYFYSSKPHPQQFTILVRSIPASSGRSYSETVESFFSEYYPATYLSHWVVRRASKLQDLIKNSKRLYRRLVNLKSANHDRERFGRSGFMGLFGQRVDLLDHYEKKLEVIEDNVRAEQSSCLGKEVGAAFVSFRTRFAAASAIHMQQGVNPTQWVTETAPDPEDVYWPFFSASFLKRWISNLVVVVACVLLTVLFLIPVLIVQGLTHLEQLEIWFPFLKGLLRIAFVSQVITGYLPSLVLQLFLYVVPSIMIMFSSIQGYIAMSQIEKSACIKVLWFTIWNIFFANVLSGSALYRVEIFLEPKNIPAILAVAVPGQATFFIAYVVTSGWTSTSSELFQLSTLVSNFIKRNICRKYDDEFEVPSVPYHSEIPRILLFGLLALLMIADCMLWIHFSAVYILTAVVCYLLYFEYDYISSKRISYFYSSKPHPQQFTILVRSIPASSGRSYSETVESFFSEYYPATYLSHWVVRRASKLQDLIKNSKRLYRRLVNLKSANHDRERFGRSGFMGLFGQRVDLLDHYEKKLEVIEDNVRAEQSSCLGKEVGAAFVSFRTRFAAASAIHMQQGVNPTQWVTETAPDPEDVYWPFFSASFLKRWISNLVVVVACVLLTVLFLIPVLIVQGLTHLEQLEIWFPFLKGLLRIAFVSQVITGYLPSLVLQLFLYVVPSIMIMFSSIQGYIAMSQIEKSACIKVLWFTIWNIFFANVLSGSALYRVEIFLEPKNIPAILAVAVPGQATFFIAYVVTSGWTSTSSELFQLSTLVSNFIKRNICRKYDDEFEVPSVPYHSEIPRILLFGLLGITYFFLAPLILPFLLVYYCLGYLIYRNQLLNVYAPKYETGGKLWPIVHDSMIFSLILMHVIAIGIFGLKKLPLASSLTVPLPILTLVFNSYCRRRFLPMFKSYSVESLLKKDKEEQNDPTIASFHERLATAYQDPALLHGGYSGNSASIIAPLLSTAEVDA